MVTKALNAGSIKRLKVFEEITEPESDLSLQYSLKDMRSSPQI